MSDARKHMAQQIGALLDGALTGNEAALFLGSIDLDQLTPEDLAGAVDAVMDRAVGFPAFPKALDCSGTGGDGMGTYNISTAAAFVAAARGLTIAKHGNRAITSKSGSADVLEALGADMATSVERTAEILQEVGIAFLFAPIFHPGFARVAPLRKALGKRTIFNLLGPLCNPARVRRQLIGVFQPEFGALFAEAAKLLGREQVIIATGKDGTDELSITDLTYLTHLSDEKIVHSVIRPQDIGITPSPGRALMGGNAAQNARAMRDVLGGLDGPYADAVALNAAALFMLSGDAPSLEHGVALARGTLARGEALKKLDQFIEATQA